MTTQSTCTSAVVVACVITFIVLLFCIMGGYYRWKNKTCEVEDPETRERFIVQNNKNEPEEVRREVARRLSNIVIRVDKLVEHMLHERLPDREISERLHQRWLRIRKNPRGLRETAPGETSAAYTINKGEQMRICVRNRKGQSFEDENDTMFVILHELGHLMSKSFGHNMEFRRNFAYITKIAVKLGIYRYTNYQQSPTSYCNVDITNTAY